MRIDVTCIDSGGEVAPDNLFSFARDTRVQEETVDLEALKREADDD
jgi:hypothetical protein